MQAFFSNPFFTSLGAETGNCGSIAMPNISGNIREVAVIASFVRKELWRFTEPLVRPPILYRKLTYDNV